VAIVVLVALVVGTVGQSTPTDEQRAQNLAETIRCPSCKSQSAASSDTPSSLAVRALIAERIDAGDSDEEIRDFVASRYGREVLLDPSGSGFGALVWALPVIFVIGAVAFLIARFQGYGRSGSRHATAADEALVAEALGGSGPPSARAPEPEASS
jgi:cytochrome c-type biogenesis protein CcmH